MLRLIDRMIPGIKDRQRRLVLIHLDLDANNTRRGGCRIYPLSTVSHELVAAPTHVHDILSTPQPWPILGSPHLDMSK